MTTKYLNQMVPDAAKMAVIARVCEKLSHDLNNILGAIEGYSSLAASGLPADSPAREDMRDVRLSVAAAAEITGKLMLFAGRKAMNRAPWEPAAVLKEAVAIWAGAGKAQAKFKIEAPQLPRLQLDAALLAGAVAALLDNAGKACGEAGEIILRAELVKLRGAEIKNAALPRGGADFLRVSVSDTGSGIAPENMERLFEPFFTTRKSRGLGLSGVYGTAKMHKGWAEAASQQGGGSEFSLVVPALPA